ncbi:hypothetical protein [Pantoea agglomerans]|uniref:hypothetical protein n=1 Tax=Enterobacter agglomerans TaxID=549 RepID=UPI0016546D6F|nr:hypothetical protein [Pantoea agglomerans]
MNNNHNRRVIYVLPFVWIEDEIFIDGFTLKPYQYILKDESLQSLLEGQPFNRSCGAIIETSNFKSGDEYDSKTDYYILRLLEAIKFSFFITSQPERLDCRGFFGAESFELFRIIEKREDFINLKFEHKVTMSNGMNDFSYSLDEYYKSRAQTLNNFTVKLHASDLILIHKISKHIDNENISLIMKLYNKCWGIYSIHDKFDKALYSRVSIEVLIKEISGLTKKNYIDTFITTANSLIKKSSTLNKEILSLYEINIEPCLGDIKKQLEKYLLALTDARHSIAHDGLYQYEFKNVPPYLIFFPVFFIVFFNKEEIDDCDLYRIIFFLGLFTYDMNKWNEYEIGAIHTTRSPISTYLYFSRVFYKFINVKHESVPNYVEAITRWIKK